MMSPTLSQSNMLDAEETVRELCEQPRRVRENFIKKINSGIKTLTKDKTVDVSDYIDDDIRELAKYPVSCDSMNRLLPFFSWLMEIQRQNALEMEKSRYMLNDAAANMDRSTGDFLRSYSDLMGQEVSFIQEDGKIIMNAHEQFWGKASIVFPNIETKFNGTFPIVGLVFWIEAEHNNGKYKFSFLLNVEFGNEENYKRLLQDRNWVKLTFECSRPYMELNTFDYGKALKDFGRCGHEFIQGWCNELLNKEIMIGDYSLSDKEKELLPIAKVFRLSYQLADIESGLLSNKDARESRLSDKVLETLENRYRFNQFEELLKGAGQDDLYDFLNKAMEAWSCSDFFETSRNIWSFARLLREKEREDTIRPLYKKIIDLMCSCTSEFSAKSRIYGTYAEAEEKMRQTVEPNLLNLGFTGEYPHYRRRRGKKGEYITVRTADMSEHTMNGVMMYRFSISAAVKKLDTKDKASYLAGGLPFEETTAEDCRSISRKNVKFVELGGSIDGMTAVMCVDIFDGPFNNQKVADNAMLLNKFVSLAEKSMRRKKAPHWYKKMRRNSTVKIKSETTLSSIIMKYMPIGLYLSVLLAAGYMLCDRYFAVADYIPGLTSENAILLALVIGLLTALICSLFKFNSLKKRIWWY